MQKFRKTGESQFLNCTNNFQLSRSLIQEIVTEHIHYKKLRQMGAKNVEGCPQGETHGGSVDVSGALPQRGDEFLDHIVTGDETWIAHITRKQAAFLTVEAY
jgi:hypothetical protein